MEFSGWPRLWSTGGAVAVAEGTLARPSGSLSGLVFCPGLLWEELVLGLYNCRAFPVARIQPWKSLGAWEITDSAGQAPLGHHPPQKWISVFTLTPGCFPRDVRESFVWFRAAEHRGISLCSSQEHFVGLLKSLCIGSLIYILLSSKILILS